jgi:hypothetical protein
MRRRQYRVVTYKLVDGILAERYRHFPTRLEAFRYWWAERRRPDVARARMDRIR